VTDKAAVTALQRGYTGPAGSQVHYRMAGNGPSLVLLAPTPRSSTYYLDLIPHLMDFTVVAVDTPGFGLSDPIPGQWSMLDLADRLGTALERLELGDWHVLGIHSGNKIGAALCLVKPDRVRRLLFAGMTHSILLDKAARNRAMRAVYRSPDAVPDPDHPPDPRRRLAQRWHYVRQVITAAWDRCDPLHLDGVERRSTLRRVEDEVRGFETFDELYLANFSFDLEAALRAMTVETVVMEFVTPGESHLDRQAELLVDAIPVARAVTLFGSDGHLVSGDAATFAEAIRSAVTQPFGDGVTDGFG
jgi:pimeloyl-ACP methyl ester carboxylesterase